MSRETKGDPVLFGELTARAAATWPDAIAVTFEEESFTFSELDAAVDRAARALLARGIGKGDCVGLWVTNRPEWMIAFFAIEKIGAVAVPLNTRYREHDIAFTIRRAECKLLFTIDESGPIDYVGMLEAAIPGFEGGALTRSADFPHLESIVVISGRGVAGAGGELSWDRFLGAADSVSPAQLASAAAAVKHGDMALIIFTSGTTGNPKGVMHDHSCAANIGQRALSWPLRAGDSTLNYLPLFHVYSLGEILVAGMFTGVRQVLMDTFDPERALRLVEKERITGLHGFETHWVDLMRAHDRLKTDLRSVTFGTLPAGQESSTAVARQVNERICPTVTGFGMSEIWGWVCWTTLDDSLEQRVASSGRPGKGLEIRIVDPITGAPVATGALGEILFRGYTVMLGYFREPEATAQTIDQDGWLHTGDQGYVQDDGTVVFKGRYKEMLKVGGENVSPAAVELELMQLVPSIAAVAVIGYPDERLSEVPVAYVVVKAGETCDAEQVRARCKGKIASFKIPRHVIVVPSLPATASGKVQRVLLKAQVLKDLPPV